MLSAGELNWLGTIIACECDPRVLLIDDYGMYFNSTMEKDFFRSQLIKMNRSLGTTIILTSSSDIYLKYFASSSYLFGSRTYIKNTNWYSRFLKRK